MGKLVSHLADVTEEMEKNLKPPRADFAETTIAIVVDAKAVTKQLQQEAESAISHLKWVIQLFSGRDKKATNSMSLAGLMRRSTRVRTSSNTV